MSQHHGLAQLEMPVTTIILLLLTMHLLVNAEVMVQGIVLTQVVQNLHQE